MGDDEMEEGEDEMEEGEADMEEGDEDDEFIEMDQDQDDDEFVSDDEDEASEKPPKAIPIEKDTVGINHTTKSESSGVSDIDVDDYGSSEEEYDSDELD